MQHSAEPVTPLPTDRDERAPSARWCAPVAALPQVTDVLARWASLPPLALDGSPVTLRVTPLTAADAPGSWSATLADLDRRPRHAALELALVAGPQPWAALTVAGDLPPADAAPLLAFLLGLGPGHPAQAAPHLQALRAQPARPDPVPGALPFVLPRPEGGSAGWGAVHAAMPSGVTASGATGRALLLAAVTLLLARYQNTPEVRVQVRGDADDRLVTLTEPPGTVQVAEWLGQLEGPLPGAETAGVPAALVQLGAPAGLPGALVLSGGAGLQLALTGPANAAPTRSAPMLTLAYRRELTTEHAARTLLGQLTGVLAWLAGHPQQPVGLLDLGRPDPGGPSTEASGPRVPASDLGVHEWIEAQVRRTPDAVAVRDARGALTYAQLDARAERWAARLRDLGVGPDVPVGLCLDRTPDMLVALLAVLKAGGAYLPLDPAFPAQRRQFMLRHARAPLVIGGRRHLAGLDLGEARGLPLDGPADDPPGGPPADAPAGTGRPFGPGQLAYVMYTSGSTGVPKGVMVEHRNVTNFFAAMDRVLRPQPGGRWLAVTSLSFDISVLELLWTLARGFEVILYRAPDTVPPARTLQFSLSFFASDADGSVPGPGRYRLLFEGARFADASGFTAVWTPERHFHAFGGLYPNPALTTAALAARTSRVQLRAGSVVLPLHQPLRVAEDWAVLDNMSGGRVGVAFASGWQVDDFALAPERYGDRHAALREHLHTLRRLWAGEAVEAVNGLGQTVALTTRPRPVQPQLPVWLTAAGNVETFRQAGELGTGVLTHLLGQSLGELALKVSAYREAYARAGHPGRGHVTLMMHTYLDDTPEAVDRAVRAPMKRYLRGAVDLIRDAAWTFPAHARLQQPDGVNPGEVNLDALTPEDLDALLDHAFERYAGESGLFGTPGDCLETLSRVQDADVDELACLIDFGVPDDQVLGSLTRLARLRDLHVGAGEAAPPSLGELMSRHGVTHLQCTPSHARLLLTEPGAARGLSHLLIGGETFPRALADELLAQLPPDAQLINMYGPTETTVWSLAQPVTAGAGAVPIGQPIANTDVWVMDAAGRAQPPGAAGELWIGGAGVTRGYLDQPDRTAERFVPHPQRPGERLYRTGDLVRQLPGGPLEFLGRADHQVKVRGYRIELGDVEAALCAHPAVREAAVVTRPDAQGNAELHAFFTWAALPVPLAQLRGTLAERLPGYMVPSRWWPLDRLPLTPNGKVDRLALVPPAPITPAPVTPAPVPPAPVTPEPVTPEPAPAPVSPAAERAALPPAGWTPAPTSDFPPGNAGATPGQGTTSGQGAAPVPAADLEDLEGRVREVWRALLGVSEIGPHDNFFDLGGHSLLAVALLSRLREQFDPGLKLTDIFRYPSVRTLSARLAGQSGAGAVRPARAVRRGDRRAAALGAPGEG